MENENSVLARINVRRRHDISRKIRKYITAEPKHLPRETTKDKY